VGWFQRKKIRLGGPTYFRGGTVGGTQALNKRERLQNLCREEVIRGISQGKGGGEGGQISIQTNLKQGGNIKQESEEPAGRELIHRGKKKGLTRARITLKRKKEGK